jgi:ribosome-associated toxin RatA of RatAB toxin-antitoxin module
VTRSLFGVTNADVRPYSRFLPRCVEDKVMRRRGVRRQCSRGVGVKGLLGVRSES